LRPIKTELTESKPTNELSNADPSGSSLRSVRFNRPNPKTQCVWNETLGTAPDLAACPGSSPCHPTKGTSTRCQRRALFIAQASPLFPVPSAPKMRSSPEGDGVAPFGDRGINACSRLPHAYRSYATSFIGTQRRGIHPLLILSSLKEDLDGMISIAFTGDPKAACFH
jgi:hypothetical protein